MQKDNWERCPYCGSRSISIDVKTLRRQCEICLRRFYPETYPAVPKDETNALAFKAVIEWSLRLN